MQQCNTKKTKKTYRAISICLLFTIFITFNFSPKKANAGIQESVKDFYYMAISVLTGGNVTMEGQSPITLWDIGETAYNKLKDFCTFTQDAYGDFVVTVKETFDPSQLFADDFKVSKEVELFKDFPFTSTMKNGAEYGTFTVNVPTKITVYDGSENIIKGASPSSAINPNNKAFLPGYTYKIWAPDTISKTYSKIMIYEMGYPGNYPQFLGAINLQDKVEVWASGFTLKATDWLGDNTVPITVTQKETIAYDGTQFNVTNSKVIDKGTTITGNIPPNSPPNIPNKITSPEDLGVTVTPPTDDGGSDTGWLGKIINAIKKVGLTITDGFNNVINSIKDIGFAIADGFNFIIDWFKLLPIRISTWWNSLWDDVPELDFSPITSIKFGNVFPFSIPYDFYNLFAIFLSPAKTPIFELPIWTEKIVVDLTQFELIAKIIRFSCIFGFSFYLITKNKKMEE